MVSGGNSSAEPGPRGVVWCWRVFPGGCGHTRFRLAQRAARPRSGSPSERWRWFAGLRAVGTSGIFSRSCPVRVWQSPPSPMRVAALFPASRIPPLVGNCLQLAIGALRRQHRATGGVMLTTERRAGITVRLRALLRAGSQGGRVTVRWRPGPAQRPAPSRPPAPPIPRASTGPPRRAAHTSRATGPPTRFRPASPRPCRRPPARRNRR